MAYRIHGSVARGEIDNRRKGIVRGKIWLEGRADPMVLELKGNAWPDLAGCLLNFTNPQPRIPHPHLDSLHGLQLGSLGDLTASRKVRVFAVPLEQALAMIRRKEKPPEHMANSLYLEWFSQANGRVVIESADYVLTISAPEWRMTPQENAERATAAAAGMEEFMERLTEAVEQQQRAQKGPEEPWDEHDYEKFLKECDARTEKYGELLDKYGDSDEAEERIAHGQGDGVVLEGHRKAAELAQEAGREQLGFGRDRGRTVNGNEGHPELVRQRGQHVAHGDEAEVHQGLPQLVAAVLLQFQRAVEVLLGDQLPLHEDLAETLPGREQDGGRFRQLAFLRATKPILATDEHG